MWPVVLFLGRFNNFEPDYRLQLELHTLTQAARSYVLLETLYILYCDEQILTTTYLFAVHYFNATCVTWNINTYM